eukprot:12188125-Heterocapsa_arctica.AAC.1
MALTLGSTRTRGASVAKSHLEAQRTLNTPAGARCAQGCWQAGRSPGPPLGAASRGQLAVIHTVCHEPCTLMS